MTNKRVHNRFVLLFTWHFYEREMAIFAVVIILLMVFQVFKKISSPLESVYIYVNILLFETLASIFTFCYSGNV